MSEIKIVCVLVVLMADIPDWNTRSHTLLCQMADKLGIPVASFYDDETGEAGDLLTLMRLWSAIGNQQGRRRVLMAAKLEFERSEGDEEAEVRGSFRP